MTKTATEWLNEARANGADWVDKALENIALQLEGEASDKHYPCLSRVIMCHFSWVDTDKETQGHKYWWDIYKSIENSETKNSTP